jgi:hypothetical protein
MKIGSESLKEEYEEEFTTQLKKWQLEIKV